MGTIGLPAHLILDDWRGPTGASIYATELGVELAAGDLHSGTTWSVIVLGLPTEIKAEILSAYERHGAVPVFRVVVR